MEMKDQKKAAETAEQRMAMISPLLNPNLGKASVSQLKKQQCETYGVSERTLERYCRRYLESGFECRRRSKLTEKRRFILTLSAGVK